MSYFPHGAIAAIHAERERKKQEEEEEKMTTYNSDELDKWEFKIVRNDSNAFRKPEVLQTLIDEEAMSGWELLEKLDDRRVRFKRPKTAGNDDFNLPPGIDPYRSHYGRSSIGVKIGLVMGVLMVALMTGVYFFMEEGSSLTNYDWTSMSTMIPIIGIMVALLGVVFVVIRRR